MEGWRFLGYVSISLFYFVSLFVKCSNFFLLIQILLFTRADSISEMKNVLHRLREQLGSDSIYFEQVYKYTFDFARNEGQRSVGENFPSTPSPSPPQIRHFQNSYFVSGLETAQAFWSLLIPYGLTEGALTRVPMQDDENGNNKDVDMDECTDGWKQEYLQWWFDFLNERGGKGITKDTWIMVCLYTLFFP